MFHFHLAQTHSLPLILHCFKAYSDFVSFCKSSKTPILFHGFNGKENGWKALSRFEHVYFLSGKFLIQTPRSQDLIFKIDLNKILLDTDNGPFPIGEIYGKSSSILNLRPVESEIQMKNNAFNFFGATGLH